MITALHNLRLLLLGAWIGAAVFFSAAVAPNAFRVLRTFGVHNATEVAGAIVSGTLYVVNSSGLVVCFLLMLTALVLRRSYSLRGYVLQLILLAIVGGATAMGEWFIARKMRALKATAVVSIDQFSTTDPVRVAFDALHGYSVAALSIAIIAALLGFFVIGNSYLDRPR